MSSDLIQKKYYDRVQFTTAEKEDIAYKTDCRCAHCGYPIFVGYQLTVDHFIPLDKGGSNQFINLIPLCPTCNAEKGNKLYNIDYIKYIRPKYKKQISDYLDSYLQVIDYVQRHRLLAYDSYERSISIYPQLDGRRKSKYKPCVKCNYLLKYATWDDLDKMTDYLIRYLDKNNNLDSKEAARENIIFWLKFGCIYYVEKNNEVTSMFALTIKHLGTEEDYRGIYNQPMMYIFPYYHNQVSKQITMDMIYDIPKLICDENHLSFIPLNVVLLNQEKMIYYIATLYDSEPTPDVVSGLSVFHIVVGSNNEERDYNNIHLEYEDMTKEEQATYDFFNKFNNVSESMTQYFEKYDNRSEISWMINGIFSHEVIKNSKLSTYIKFNDDGGDSNG